MKCVKLDKYILVLFTAVMKHNTITPSNYFKLTMTKDPTELSETLSSDVFSSLTDMVSVVTLLVSSCSICKEV